MTDPLSLVAIGAAVGGAAGKFVEKAWDAGEKWIACYFADHKPKAQEQAKVNSADFLNSLAHRIKALEDRHQVEKERIQSAQDHPDFSVLLQKALLSAAQTDREDKHELLARLVAERLRASPESLLSMASKMACDAISYTNLAQLKILGLLSLLHNIMPIKPIAPTDYQKWLEMMLSPYEDLDFKPLDLKHLEGLSCVKIESFIGRDIKSILKLKNENFDDEVFSESRIGKRIRVLWKEKSLQKVALTSVGQIIGVYVSDMVTNTNTEFRDWY